MEQKTTMKESDIQKEVIQYARSKGLLVQANPLAEVMGFVPEKSRHKMVAFAKSMGWLSGYPDVSIDFGGSITLHYMSHIDALCHGLRIELKSKSPFVASGQLSKNDHIHKQSRMLARLWELDYLACFAWSVDMAKEIIDKYVKGDLEILERSLTIPNRYTGEDEEIILPIPILK